MNDRLDDNFRLTFRRAEMNDVADIVRLVESAYRGESSRVGWTTEADLLAGQRTDAGDVGEAITRPGCELLLAVMSDEVVGCCQLARSGPDEAYFGMFAVRPALQGSGIGSAVLDEAERVAREEWGVYWMRLTVIIQRDELIDWYHRRGYRPTGDVEPFPYEELRFGLPLRDDLAFIVLRKQLSRG